MTAEYFLSAYLTATGEASLFWQRHDQCVALWRRHGDRVDLVRYWELERLSGLKHHVWPSFTDEQRTGLLAALLATEGLTLSDVTDIWGLPDAGDSSQIVDLARRHRLSVHSLGHLFSSVLLDPEIFRHGTIVALAIDGGPDFVLEDRVPPYWYAGAVVQHGELHLRPAQSPGLIYTAAVMTFGQEPGTLMAATSACSCRADLRSLSEAAMEGLTFYGARDSGWSTATRLVKAAVDEARGLLATGTIGRCGEDRLAPDEHVRTVVMRRIQQIAEQIAVRGVQELIDEFGVDPGSAYLSMSGGSALNCPTNSLLLSRFGFRGLLCPPCANDGGQALGLGLAGLYGRGVLPAAKFTFPGAYAGPASIGIEDALRRYESMIVSVSDLSADRFVDDLAAGPVAWMDGASEIGPRALGHRSLLADPRQLASKDRLNAMKDRQWWRPVAPMILEDRVGEWFEGGHRSPYMLEVFPVAGSKRELVPAIVHLDGTARVQTVSAGDDPRLCQALTAFEQRTGVPLLCNTSLNAKGEPIVQTASQAIDFCLAKGVRVLYVEGARIELVPAPPEEVAAGPGPREAELFSGQELARDELWRDLERRGVGIELMALVARAPQLAHQLGSDRARRKLQAIAQRVIEQDPAWQVYLDHLRSTFGPGGTFEGAFADTGTAEDALMPVVADLMQR